MRRILDWLVRNWKVVPLFTVVQGCVFIFVMYVFPGGWIELLAGIMLYATLLLQAVQLVVLLCRKQWKRFLLLLPILVILIVLTPVISLLAMSAPDGYARHHPIPDGMVLNNPLGQEVAVADSNDTDSFLQIWNGIQGGIYEYDFYYPSLKAGTLFLRCFEAGKNEPLSSDKLETFSSVGHAATNGFSKVAERQRFYIYEGDWGEYYAVRVEVWHRDSTSNRETKLMEKLYRMEGWMR